MVKYIDNDTEMCYPVQIQPGEYELKSCQVQNYSLHEDLGQIDYLFCDKTGTLTKNELVFNKWSCCGIEDPENSRKSDSDSFKDLLRCIVLCHDVLLISLEGKDGEIGVGMGETGTTPRQPGAIFPGNQFGGDPVQVG